MYCTPAIPSTMATDGSVGCMLMSCWGVELQREQKSIAARDSYPRRLRSPLLLCLVNTQLPDRWASLTSINFIFFGKNLLRTTDYTPRKHDNFSHHVSLCLFGLTTVQKMLHVHLLCLTLRRSYIIFHRSETERGPVRMYRINTQGSSSALERRHTNKATKTWVAYGNSYLACE